MQLPPVAGGRRFTGEVSDAVPGPHPVAGGTTGGYVITSWQQEANSFDAAVGYDFQSWEALNQLLYAPLYSFEGQDGGPEANAARALPKLEKGGRRLIIELRPGVRFANGRDVTAEDYIYSWERVLDPDVRSWAASYLYPIAGAEELYKGEASSLAGVRARGRMTLEIELTKPDETFIGILTQPYTAAVPREEVERYGKKFDENASGAGPFRLESYDLGAREAIFVRNPHYFWKGLPYLDQVIFRWQLEPQLQIEQLQRGDIDMIGDGISSSLVAQVNSNPALQPFVEPVVLQANRWVALNLRRPPLDDARVRQALNYATDREQLSRITYGEATPWGGPLPRDLTPSGADTYDYDPERAQALLAEAGAEGLAIELLISSEADPWPQFAQILQQQWAGLGIDIEIAAVGAGAFYERTVSTDGADADSWGDNWYYTTGNALELAAATYVTGGASNYSGYSNPQVDKLVERSRSAGSNAERETLLAEINELITVDAPSVFLQNINYVAGRNPDLSNFQYRGEYGAYYDRLWVS